MTMTKITIKIRITNKTLHWKPWKGDRHGGRPFLVSRKPAAISELLLVPDFSAAEAAASLPMIFWVS
jgi:hypothetical protein